MPELGEFKDGEAYRESFFATRREEYIVFDVFPKERICSIYFGYSRKGQKYDLENVFIPNGNWWNKERLLEAMEEADISRITCVSSL